MSRREQAWAWPTPAFTNVLNLIPETNQTYSVYQLLWLRTAIIFYTFTLFKHHILSSNASLRCIDVLKYSIDADLKKKTVNFINSLKISFWRLGKFWRNVGYFPHLLWILMRRHKLYIWRSVANGTQQSRIYIAQCAEIIRY